MRPEQNDDLMLRAVGSDSSELSMSLSLLAWEAAQKSEPMHWNDWFPKQRQAMFVMEWIQQCEESAQTIVFVPVDDWLSLGSEREIVHDNHPNLLDSSNYHRLELGEPV